ncbi:MAG: 50S ribosomal protein L29 [Candidatus Thermoplasmatota archaeon]|nr:50S ribosomal protein L29 [Candidatus Thermoplasmatota archaeon]
MKAKETRAMSEEDRAKTLEDMRMELLRERGVVAMGGTTSNTMRIRELRKNIARILTVEREVKQR